MAQSRKQASSEESAANSRPLKTAKKAHYYPRELYHYPSTRAFPVVMDDSFPAEPYASRNGEVKSAIHWGQRKLLMSEIQLLCMYCRSDVSYHIVYAGAAPGTHLAFLDEMFASRHTWELVDPGRFDRPVLESRPNFTLCNEFFTNATAYRINARRLKEVCPALGAVYEYVAVTSVESQKKDIHERLESIVGTLDVARGTEDIPSMHEFPLILPKGLELLAQVGQERNKPLLFISDIRSGSLALPNFEDHVAENMRAQEAWTMILQGEQSMLKFRLPYTRTAQGFGGKDSVAAKRLIRSDGTVPYLRGDMILPIWTRPTSTEGRLVVPQGAFQKDYTVAHVENQFFFFNSRVREQVHFNHILLRDKCLDHHYDSAAEVHCLKTYLEFMNPGIAQEPLKVLRQEIKRVSASITEHLGITFGDAIRRREALMIKQARQGILSCIQTNGDDDDDEIPQGCASIGNSLILTEESRKEWEASTRQMIRLAWRERERTAWAFNVDEEKHHTLSGLWVTTKMKQ